MAETGKGFDPKRMVIIFYVFAAVVLAVFLEKVFALGFSYARVRDFPVLGEDYPLSAMIGYAVAIVAAVLVWKTPKVHTVSFEIASELNKVTWPTMRETQAATVAVLVATVVAAAILGVFDYVWARLSSLVY